MPALLPDALSISYCAGWLRTVENTFMNHSFDTVRAQNESVRALLGFGAYDGQAQQSGMLGLYENGHAGRYLMTSSHRTEKLGAPKGQYVG